jgi:hypothetical protein
VEECANFREREFAMRIAPLGLILRPWLQKVSALVQVNVAGARATDNRERAGVPQQERLLLAGLLLVVACWIIMRLLLSPFAAQ